MNTNQHKTSETRMIATDVVHQQAEVCAVKMTNVEGKVEDLSKKFDTFSAKMSAEVAALTTAAAVLKTRWQLFAIVGGVVGVGGTLTGILVAIFK